MGFIRMAKEQIKGVVDVAKSAGINSINDSKFKEAVVLPEHVSSEAFFLQKTRTEFLDKVINIPVFLQTVVLSLYLKVMLLSL